MSDLLDFTREEWADRPYLIELRGGYYDGKRHHWHELPTMWRQPEPVSLCNFLSYLDLDPTTDANPVPIANYWPTGHVTDDGAHVYQLGGYR